jgi:LysM repeat protein
LGGYLLKTCGLLLAVGILAYLLWQLGQLGKQPPPALPTPVPAVSAPVGPAAGSQPTPIPLARPGQGPLRTSSRVIEPSYTVASGDTLGSIAARFGTSVEAIQSINNLQDRNALQVGQKLVLPNQE